MSHGNLICSGKGVIFEQNRVERSFSIEDFLYTKSLCKIRINLIQDLHGIKDIDIPCGKNAQ